MKKLFTFFTAILFTGILFAQSPQKMSYQAVVRDASNKLVVNHQVGMQISIVQSSEDGTAIYTETQTPTTNANGLVSIKIGGGDGFATIDWANGPYFIKTETDPAGGTSYTITGVSQLLSVPYALHAKTAESVTGGQDISGIAINATAISNEKIRAMAAEALNATAIASNTTNITTNAIAILNEKVIARDAEGANAYAISNEEVRARAAEVLNAAAISDEKIRAMAAEVLNATAIATNITNIATNAIAISNEELRAKAAEALNVAAIATNTTNIATNTTAISAEEVRARAAEALNAAAIATNTTNITANATAISDEKVRAMAAEVLNATAIATNTTAISAEKARAMAAEVLNAAAIATNTTNITTNASHISDIQNEQTTQNTAIALNTAKTGITSAQATAITTNTTAISAEEVRARAAEVLNAAAIATNTTNITTNATAISTKVDKVTGKGLSTNDYTTAEQTKLAAITGTNTGDNATNTKYSGLVSNATHDGDAEGATTLTVKKINGVTLSSLATGILKNTTGTGVPSIAVAGTDYSLVREFSNEYSATVGQTSFTLSNTPSASCQIKMYINGIRIAKAACTLSGTTATYVPGSNGLYVLVAGDRIQIDYYY